MPSSISHKVRNPHKSLSMQGKADDKMPEGRGHLMEYPAELLEVSEYCQSGSMKEEHGQNDHWRLLWESAESLLSLWD